MSVRIASEIYQDEVFPKNHRDESFFPKLHGHRVVRERSAEHGADNSEISATSRIKSKPGSGSSIPML